MNYGVILSFAGALEDSELGVKSHADCWDLFSLYRFMDLRLQRYAFLVTSAISEDYKFEIVPVKLKSIAFIVFTVIISCFFEHKFRKVKVSLNVALFFL